jgi:hypothetical protein
VETLIGAHREKLEVSNSQFFVAVEILTNVYYPLEAGSQRYKDLTRRRSESRSNIAS